MVSLDGLLRDQRSLLVVVFATVAGVTSPGAAAPFEPAIPLLVTGLLFVAFYGIDTSNVSLGALRVPVAVALGFLYLVVPLFLIPVSARFLSGDVLLGVVVVLAAPLTAGSSIVWTRLGGGDQLLTTSAVVLSILLAPLVTPAIVTRFADADVVVPASEMILPLASMVLGGFALSLVVPDGAVTGGQLDAFSLGAIGLLIYAALGASDLAVGAGQMALVAAVAAASILLSFAAAYAVRAFGSDSEGSVSVLFSSSMKSLSVGVVVGAMFGGGAVVATVTVFHVVQQLLSGALVGKLGYFFPPDSGRNDVGL